MKRVKGAREEKKHQNFLNNVGRKKKKKIKNNSKGVFHFSNGNR
jgi:hypothetical protein